MGRTEELVEFLIAFYAFFKHNFSTNSNRRFESCLAVLIQVPFIFSNFTFNLWRKNKSFLFKTQNFKRIEKENFALEHKLWIIISENRNQNINADSKYMPILSTLLTWNQWWNKIKQFLFGVLKPKVRSKTMNNRFCLSKTFIFFSPNRFWVSLNFLEICDICNTHKSHDNSEKQVFYVCICPSDLR